MDNALFHHGIKGMKWGQWNSETAARYAGRRGKSIRKDLKNRKRDKQLKVEEDKQTALTESQKERLRKITLSSNDPKTVQKGMHLLNDEELKQKVERLELESRINRLAYSNERSEAEIARIKNEAKQKTLGYDLASYAGKETVKSVTKPIKNLDPIKIANDHVEKDFKKPIKKAAKKAKKAAKKSFETYM